MGAINVGRGSGVGGREPCFEALRGAVLEDLQVVLSYELPGSPFQDRRVRPLGLVCNRGLWDSVATTPGELRTYRSSVIRLPAVGDDRAEQRPGFNLAATWVEAGQKLVVRAPADLRVQIAAEPDSVPRLQAMVGTWWPVEGHQRPSWITASSCTSEGRLRWPRTPMNCPGRSLLRAVLPSVASTASLLDGCSTAIIFVSGTGALAGTSDTLNAERRIDHVRP